MLAITGTVIILGGGNKGGEIIGILFSLCSVISWSAMSVIVRKITQKYDSLQVTAYACTAISHVLWNKSLSLIEASSCSLFYPLQPMISALLGSLLLGEIINLRFISGALLIIFGIIYSVFSYSSQPLTKNSVPSDYN